MASNVLRTRPGASLPEVLPGLASETLRIPFMFCWNLLTQIIFGEWLAQHKRQCGDLYPNLERVPRNARQADPVAVSLMHYQPTNNKTPHITLAGSSVSAEVLQQLQVMMLLKEKHHFKVTPSLVPKRRANRDHSLIDVDFRLVSAALVLRISVVWVKLNVNARPKTAAHS